MSSVTLKELNEKRISKPYKLTKEQEQHLLKQKNVSIDKCRDVDEVYKELKKKYDLLNYIIFYTCIKRSFLHLSKQ